MQHLKACRVLKVHIVQVTFVGEQDSDAGVLTREFLKHIRYSIKSVIRKMCMDVSSSEIWRNRYQQKQNSSVLMYSLIITRTNWRYNFWKLQAQNEHLWCKTITQMLENNTWFSPQRSGLHPINKWSLHNYYITWMQEEYALPWRVRTRHHLGWTFWQLNQRGKDCSLLKILH